MMHAPAPLPVFLTTRLNLGSMPCAICDRVTEEERLTFAQDLQRRIDSTRLRIAETRLMLDRSRRRLGEASPAHPFGDVPSFPGKT